MLRISMSAILSLSIISCGSFDSSSSYNKTNNLETLTLGDINDAEDPVSRNDLINKNYYAISKYLESYLGLPEAPNWFTFAHNASYLAGRQLRILKAVQDIQAQLIDALAKDITLVKRISHLQSARKLFREISKDPYFKSIGESVLLNELKLQNIEEVIQLIKDKKLIATIKADIKKGQESIQRLYKNLGDGNHQVFLAVSQTVKAFIDAHNSQPNFNGRVYFENDVSDLGSETFYIYYLARQETQHQAKEDLIFMANVYYGFSEQIRLQAYLGPLYDEFEIIKGSMVINDGVGDYPLTDKNWSLFCSRMACNADTITSIGGIAQISTSRFPEVDFNALGTIPSYFLNRFQDPLRHKMFVKQPKIEPL